LTIPYLRKIVELFNMHVHVFIAYMSCAALFDIYAINIDLLIG